ncbi:MAG: hypothetical protein LAT75_04390 [Candidatus Cyclonatronum sp.]|nr:hypothetical protein [Cyclonatronum sp.]MCH8486079.1 hypothetical protein [Cyclonatronum sp.]
MVHLAASFVPVHLQLAVFHFCGVIERNDLSWHWQDCGPDTFRVVI